MLKHNSFSTSFPPRWAELLGSRHRRSTNVLEKKKRQLPTIAHFLAAYFLIAERSTIPNDRSTKIIIVFPDFPFVCTLRFPVRFFELNPRRRAEEGKDRKNSRNHRSVTFWHLYQILRWWFDLLTIRWESAKRLSAENFSSSCLFIHRSLKQFDRGYQIDDL